MVHYIIYLLVILFHISSDLGNKPSTNLPIVQEDKNLEQVGFDTNYTIENTVVTISAIDSDRFKLIQQELRSTGIAPEDTDILPKGKLYVIEMSTGSKYQIYNSHYIISFLLRTSDSNNSDIILNKIKELNIDV